MEKESFYAKVTIAQSRTFLLNRSIATHSLSEQRTFLRIGCQVFEEQECGRMLVRTGAPIKTIAGMLGHTDSKTITPYLGVDQQDMTHAIT
jgi:hypothetical protein